MANLPHSFSLNASSSSSYGSGPGPVPGASSAVSAGTLTNVDLKNAVRRAPRPPPKQPRTPRECPPSALQGDCFNISSVTAYPDSSTIESCLQHSCFAAAHIPLYLYPFLNTTSKSRPFEYLRLTSLGIIGARVKVDDTEVISFLLSTEIIPLCLRTMEMGSELSKTLSLLDPQHTLELKTSFILLPLPSFIYFLDV